MRAGTTNVGIAAGTGDTNDGWFLLPVLQVLLLLLQQIVCICILRTLTLKIGSLGTRIWPVIGQCGGLPIPGGIGVLVGDATCLTRERRVTRGRYCMVMKSDLFANAGTAAGHDLPAPAPVSIWIAVIRFLESSSSPAMSSANTREQKSNGGGPAGPPDGDMVVL